MKLWEHCLIIKYGSVLASASNFGNTRCLFGQINVALRDLFWWITACSNDFLLLLHDLRHKDSKTSNKDEFKASSLTAGSAFYIAAYYGDISYQYDIWGHVCDPTTSLWPKRHKQTNNSLSLWRDSACVCCGRAMKHQVSWGVIPLIETQESGKLHCAWKRLHTQPHTHKIWLVYHFQSVDTTLTGFSLPAVMRASFVIKGYTRPSLSLILYQGHGFTLILFCVHTSAHSAGFICPGMSLCVQLYCIGTTWTGLPNQSRRHLNWESY